MSRCRCTPIDVAGCLCSASDSDCIEVTGAGTAANPFLWTPILDPDPDNLTSCGASGLLTQLPELYRNPPRVRVRNTVNQAIPPNNVAQFIEYDIADYDVGGWWDESVDPTQIVVPNDGLYFLTWRTNVGIWGGTEHERAGGASLILDSITTIDKDSGTTTDPNTGIRLQGTIDYELEAGMTLGIQVLNGDTVEGNSGPDTAGVGNMICARWVAPLAV